jgi:REP element-mobilizing transposase RayT
LREDILRIKSGGLLEGNKKEGISTMKYNPDIHHRRLIRLAGYDYSQGGYYFVTICTQKRRCLFGEIENGRMILNDAGKMIDYQWNDLASRFTHIELDEYIVMPNHFHGIIIVGATLAVAQNKNNRKNIRAGTRPVRKNIRAGTRPVRKIIRAGTRPAPTGTGAVTIGNMVGAFKSITSYEYVNGVTNNHRKPFDGKLWQRNYYEQIVRDEMSLRRIREYIVNNPSQWQRDELWVMEQSLQRKVRNIE